MTTAHATETRFLLENGFLGTQQDEVTWALARANIYNFLSTVYTEPPSGRLLDGLRTGVVGQALAAVTPDVRVEALAAWVESRERGELQQELAREYTRLFVGPGRGYIPPYESVQVDTPYSGQHGNSRPEDHRSGRLLCGPSMVAVQHAYAAAGLAIDPDQGEVPDHIGLELQFMHHLCNREAEAWNQGDAGAALEWRTRQRSFLIEHLRTWVPKFCAQVQAITNQPYYQAMAAVTIAFIESDLEW